MERIIAYCGLVCSECEAYTATQADDPVKLAQLAEKWRQAFNSPEITADSILCDGCPGTNGGRRIGYCATCEIRACALDRGLANCAHCADYACEKLENFFAQAVGARGVLDEIRAVL
jgi:hypothetical protein